jgi:C-terminal processing protease CtpA/Prc
MILVPKSTESAIGVHRDFGAKFCINNREELQVCFMWDGSQLKKNGVKVGDKITAINNNPIDRITEEQYCNFTKIQKEDSTLTLTFKTRDGEKTIEIHK